MQWGGGGRNAAKIRTDRAACDAMRWYVTYGFAWSGVVVDAEETQQHEWAGLRDGRTCCGLVWFGLVWSQWNGKGGKQHAALAAHGSSLPCSDETTTTVLRSGTRSTPQPRPVRL